MKNGWARLGGVLGIVYCVAGFVLVFLGWNGTASNDQESAQLPYLVSGGIAGLALVVLGSALIVAHSLRADRVELRGAIDDLRAASVAGTAATRPTGVTSADSTTVVAGEHSYHRSDCTLVVGQPDVVVTTRADADASGRTACRVCQPDADG